MMRPSASTRIRSARLMTACITCSVNMMVTPRSRMRRMTGSMSRTSDGLRPASTSSSRRSRGAMARARASSSRLSAEMVSVVAGCSARERKTHRVRDLGCGGQSVSPGRLVEVRADCDVIEHAQTCERLHGLKGARDASPGEAVRRLARDILAGVENPPLVRVGDPAIIENSVVLPAPLGPIKAVMRPCSTANEA